MSHRPCVLLIGAEDEENLAIYTLAAFVRAHGVDAHLAGFTREAQAGTVRSR